jgi:hypothetical protein
MSIINSMSRTMRLCAVLIGPETTMGRKPPLSFFLQTTCTGSGSGFQTDNFVARASTSECVTTLPLPDIARSAAQMRASSECNNSFLATVFCFLYPLGWASATA